MPKQVETKEKNVINRFPVWLLPNWGTLTTSTYTTLCKASADTWLWSAVPNVSECILLCAWGSEQASSAPWCPLNVSKFYPKQTIKQYFNGVQWFRKTHFLFWLLLYSYLMLWFGHCAHFRVSQMTYFKKKPQKPLKAGGTNTASNPGCLCKVVRKQKSHIGAVFVWAHALHLPGEMVRHVLHCALQGSSVGRAPSLLPECASAPDWVVQRSPSFRAEKRQESMQWEEWLIFNELYFKLSLWDPAKMMIIWGIQHISDVCLQHSTHCRSYPLLLRNAVLLNLWSQVNARCTLTLHPCWKIVLFLSELVEVRGVTLLGAFLWCDSIP